MKYKKIHKKTRTKVVIIDGNIIIEDFKREDTITTYYGIFKRITTSTFNVDITDNRTNKPNKGIGFQKDNEETKKE